MKLTRLRMNQIIREEVVNLSRIDEGEEKESEKKHEIVIPEEHFRYIMKEIEKANSWTTIDWTKVGGVLMPLLGELNRMRMEEKFGGYGYKRKYPGADRPDAGDRTPKEDLQQIVNDATLLHNMLGDNMELDFEIQKGIIIASNNLHSILNKLKEQKFEGSTLFRESKEPELIEEQLQAFAAAAGRWALEHPVEALAIISNIKQAWPEGETPPTSTRPGASKKWDDEKPAEAYEETEADSVAKALGEFLGSEQGNWALNIAMDTMVKPGARR